MTPPRGQRNDPLDELAVACWCDTRIVHVPTQDVRRGLTASCGNPNCQPPPPPTNRRP